MHKKKRIFANNKGYEKYIYQIINVNVKFVELNLIYHYYIYRFLSKCKQFKRRKLKKKKKKKKACEKRSIIIKYYSSYILFTI